MLNLHKADGEGMSEEDRDKLTRLHKERDECLRPVKIRITSYDRLSPVIRHRKTSDCDEEDIPIDALQTLEMLRIFKPLGDSELAESCNGERYGNSSSDDDEEDLDDEEDIQVSGMRGRGPEPKEEQCAGGDENESECSMQTIDDPSCDQINQQSEQRFQSNLPISSDTKTKEMDTVASGKMAR